MRTVFAAMIILCLAIGMGFGEPVEQPRFELGPIIGWMDFGAVSTSTMSTNIGGRFTLNIDRRFAVEYQMSWFPNGFIYADSAMQGSGHLKLNIWRGKGKGISLFTIAGPGFMRDQVERIGGLYHYIDKFHSAAIDYGGGLELVPNRRYAIRFDLTDFYAGRKYIGQDDLLHSTWHGYDAAPRFWEHHLDFKSALMLRF